MVLRSSVCQKRVHSSFKDSSSKKLCLFIAFRIMTTSIGIFSDSFLIHTFGRQNSINASRLILPLTAFVAWSSRSTRWWSSSLTVCCRAACWLWSSSTASPRSSSSARPTQPSPSRSYLHTSTPTQALQQTQCIYSLKTQSSLSCAVPWSSSARLVRKSWKVTRPCPPLSIRENT